MLSISSPSPPLPAKTINPAISFIINYIYHVSRPCNIPSTNKNSIIRKEQRIDYKKNTYIKCTQFTYRHDYPSMILYRTLSEINQSKSYILPQIKFQRLEFHSSKKKKNNKSRPDSKMIENNKAIFYPSDKNVTRWKQGATLWNGNEVPQIRIAEYHGVLHYIYTINHVANTLGGT